VPALRNLSKTEQAYLWLSEEIRSSHYPPGKYVNENRISRELEMNRGSVREAMNQLIAEGILEKRDNRRIYVIELEENQRKPLMEFRAVTESGAAYFAALNRSDEDIENMRKFIEEHRFLVEREYWKGVEKADERFHHHIVLASHNSMLIQAYDRSKVKLRIALTEDITRYELDYTLPDHNAILLSIENRKSEEAKQLMWSHLMKKESLK